MPNQLLLPRGLIARSVYRPVYDVWQESEDRIDALQESADNIFYSGVKLPCLLIFVFRNSRRKERYFVLDDTANGRFIIRRIYRNSYGPVFPYIYL